MTKFYIDQHGCAKNQTDGELIASYLMDAGYQLTSNPDEADFIYINTCGFIESAKKESITAIYDIKASYPKAKLILGGCLAQRYSKDLYDSMKELDGVFGNGDLTKISDFMKVLEYKRCLQTYEQKGIAEGNRPVLFNYKGTAFVKITEGCSNHCSFCAIPLIRGELRSRKPESVVKEIQQLVSNGVYEINLIGQDLAAYGTGAEDFQLENKNLSPVAQLFQMISNIEGDFIVRPLYIHPDHFNKDIIPVMQADKRFVPYFDIPFQSGDSQIIKAMNRVGPAEKYIETIKFIRSSFQRSILRTTFLTGFPGETDEAAENTKAFLQQIQPDWSGCFPYSREEDTPAYNLKKRVSEKVAVSRANALEEIQSGITEERLQQWVGQEVPVLIEEIVELSREAEDQGEGLAIGRSWFQAPDVDGCIVIRYDRDDKKQADIMKAGNVVNARILAVTGVDLDSRLIGLKKEFKQNKINFSL